MKLEFWKSTRGGKRRWLPVVNWSSWARNDSVEVVGKDGRNAGHVTEYSCQSMLTATFLWCVLFLFPLYQIC